MTDLLLHQMGTNTVEPYPFDLLPGTRLLSGVSRAIGNDSLVKLDILFGPVLLLNTDEKSKLRRICTQVSTAFDVMALDLCNYRETDPASAGSTLAHIKEFCRLYKKLRYYYLPSV